jgi:hypothetical protein
MAVNSAFFTLFLFTIQPCRTRIYLVTRILEPDRLSLLETAGVPAGIRDRRPLAGIKYKHEIRCIDASLIIPNIFCIR